MSLADTKIEIEGLGSVPFGAVRFVQEYLLDMDAARAYVMVGLAEDTDPKVIAEDAKAFLARPTTRRILKHYAKMMLEATGRKPADVLSDIIRRGNKAEAGGKYNAALHASELEGKYHKMFVDQVEVDVNDRSELLRQARERVKDGKV